MVSRRDGRVCGNHGRQGVCLQSKRSRSYRVGSWSGHRVGRILCDGIVSSVCMYQTAICIIMFGSVSLYIYFLTSTHRHHDVHPQPTFQHSRQIKETSSFFHGHGVSVALYFPCSYYPIVCLSSIMCKYIFSFFLFFKTREALSSLFFNPQSSFSIQRESYI